MDDKKEKLMAAAEKLMAVSGYEGTSTRKIAEEAGVNIAMISYYFGSKEGLYHEMVANRISYVRDTLRQLNATVADPWERLEKIINFYVTSILTRPNIHKIIHRQLSMSHRSGIQKKFAEMIKTSAMEMKLFLEEGQEKKAFRKIDTEMTMGTFIGTIFQMINSPMISAKFFGKAGINKDGSFNEIHQKRLSKHLKDLLTAHLKLDN
ncbi:MAG: TetR/AcrR family transcriptional regulator [Cyclobacteriaceae bacterium]